MLGDNSLLYAEFNDVGVMSLFKLSGEEKELLTEFEYEMQYLKTSEDVFCFYHLTNGDVFSVSSKGAERIKSLPSGKERGGSQPWCTIEYVSKSHSIILNGKNSHRELVEFGSWELIETLHIESKISYALKPFGECGDVFLQAVQVDDKMGGQVDRLICRSFISGESLWEVKIEEGVVPLGFHYYRDKVFIFSKRKTYENYEFMGLTLPVNKYSGTHLGVMSVRDRETGQELWFNDTYIPNAARSRPGVFGIVEDAISHFGLGHSFHYHIDTGKLLFPPDDLLAYMTSLRNKYKDRTGCAFGSYYFGINSTGRKNEGQAVLYQGSNNYPVDAILDLDWNLYIQEAIPAGNKVIVNYNDVLGKEYRCYEFDFGSDSDLVTSSD